MSPIPNANGADETSERKHEKLEHAISHVQLQWEAAQENSRRLAARTNGILATAALVSGLGVFKLDDIAKVEASWASCTLRVLFCLVGACVLLGLVEVIDIRPSAKSSSEPWYRLFRKFLRVLRRALRWIDDEDAKPDRHRLPFSSSLLHGEAEPGTEKQVEDPDLLELQTEAVRQIHYYRLAMAAIDLNVRNAERQSAIARGQGWLARAAFVAFAMVVVLAVSR